MAKAKVNFYWKGVFVEAGKEAPEDAPKSLVEKKVEEPKAKKTKRQAKNGKPKDLEDK